MADRPRMSDKQWRELSAHISPRMLEGFDVDQIQGASSQQRRLFSLPRGFRLHRANGNYHLIVTATALALYGEVDRAVSGLLPLAEAPIWDYNIPEYGSTLYAVHATYFFAEAARRQDLLKKLAPLRNVPQFHAPKALTMSGRMLSHDLDLTPSEAADMEHITQIEWIKRYVVGIAGFARAYTFGGSDEYPPDRLLHEIGRYSTKIFSTRHFETYCGDAYRGQS